MTCTFFGHSGCYDLDAVMLQDAMEQLIGKGISTFYVGNHGLFDRMVLRCLTNLKETHPHISYSVVLAYFPKEKSSNDTYPTLYPEGQETVPPKFAIEKRNKWMIERSQYCLCYVNHTWGGAYRFAKRAKKRGLVVINLGNADI